MIKLSERMMMAANMVRKGSRIADIGTDHAYLPAYLILNGFALEAVAGDVRSGPLANAEKTVKLYGLEGKIKLRLSDGFDSISPDEADDYIICGMGGTLMTELISRTEWLKDKTKKLILQPQSHAEDIRKYLLQNGFEIICEDACIDSGKPYFALSAVYTGQIQHKSEAYFYYGKLPECEKQEAGIILQNTLKRLKTKLEAAEKFGSDDEVSKLRDIVSETENILNGYYGSKHL